MDLQVDVIGLAVEAVVGLVTTGTLAYLVRFVKEQREVNRANALANRSMQRDVLFRYFRIVVEQGVPITPEEFDHVGSCYAAYHENGGNGTGTLMWERIKENVRIDTGRS